MSDWLRPDGTQKRNGFLGPQRRPDGGVMTEYSIGNEMGDFPTLVSTLTPAELQQLLSITNDMPLPSGIEDKAVAHARLRSATGQPLFAGDNESPVPSRPPGPYRDELVRPNTSASLLNSLLASFVTGRK